MKLYEVNTAIEELIDNSVDPETGEIITDFEEMTAQLDGLEMERQRILEYLAKLVLNTRADVSTLKEEECRLKSRREKLLKKENRLMEILDRECGGEKTDLGVATLCYRKTTKLNVDDTATAVDWLISNGHRECLRISAPEVAKDEVKKLINSGASVPGCTVVEDRSCSLR